jgi:hypothetical protein
MAAARRNGESINGSESAWQYLKLSKSTMAGESWRLAAA